MTQKKLMGKSFYTRDNCRSCKSNNLVKVVHQESTPLGEEYIKERRPQEHYPVEVSMCRDCSLLQLLDVVDPEVLYPDYFYVTTLSAGLVKHFKDYVKSVINKLNVPTDRLVIDIGSNDGTLLRAFNEEGLRVLGVDPAKEIARRATEDGYETIPEFFSPDLASRIKSKHGLAGLITSNNTIANIDNIDGVIDGIKGVLDKDGVFVTEVQYALDLFQNNVVDNIYHEHLSYFSVRSLGHLFESRGMELIDVERTPMKGGSLRAFVQYKGGSRRISSSVSELQTLEESCGLYREDFFSQFQKRVSDEKERVKGILKKAKAEGKTVAGFGASVGATVMLYNLEIGEFVDFIVDDYKPKHNLFSPGFHIPTFPPDEIDKRKPDFIVNLAWRYAPLAIKKYERFGGKFITPFSRMGE